MQIFHIIVKRHYLTQTHENPNQTYSRLILKECGMTGRCAAVDSSHIHEVAFSPVHLQPLSPELKGVHHRPAYPLSRKCMNKKQKSWFPNKEFKTLAKKKVSGAETHTHKDTELTLLSNVTASVSHLFTVFKHMTINLSINQRGGAAHDTVTSVPLATKGWTEQILCRKYTGKLRI